RGVNPDRRCSPGAYYSGLTKAVLCSPTFRTGTIRNVPQSETNTVERENGMPARLYGRTIEIDHIVSLELGGSNDPANLYPEPGSGRASYHVKDGLENRLHDLVCDPSSIFHPALIPHQLGRYGLQVPIEGSCSLACRSWIEQCQEDQDDPGA